MDRETSTSYYILERMLLDESAEPTSLPLSLLQHITNHFSLDNEIGRGGFAVVYKGMVGKGMVAVKKLSNTFVLHENKFHEEVRCLLNAKHKNIVRFLGYCAETQGKMQKFEGEDVMAEQRNWLLCFEYVCNGSLDTHITDATCGLNWRERYRIIKGITEGLLFLHERRILHLDLKPANILLDGHMVPKIADFGLSRRLGEDQTRVITENISGTLGYMAPEYMRSKQIAFTSDIYSLGVIIMEILTGPKLYLNEDDVVVSWMNRLDASERHMQLEQVRVCSKIVIECMNWDPKKRPVARHIIDRLDKTTSADHSETRVGSLSFESQISLPREQFREMIGKFGAESLQKADAKKHSILEDGAERLECLHMQECQLKVGQLPLWGLQDTKEKVNQQRGVQGGSSPPPPPPSQANRAPTTTASTLAKGPPLPPPPPPPPPPGAHCPPPPPPPHGAHCPPPPPPPPLPAGAIQRTPAPPPPPLMTGKIAPAPPPGAHCPPPPPPGAHCPPPPPPPPLPAGAIQRTPAPPPPPLGKKAPARPPGAHCPPPPPPPPLPAGAIQRTPAPPPPPVMTRKKAPAPPPPPPQAPKPPGTVPPPSSKFSNAPAPPPLLGRGRAATGSGKGRGIGLAHQSNPPRKSSVRPLPCLYVMNVTRALQGSLWAYAQNQGNQARAPDIDLSELETLFSTAVATNASEKGGIKPASAVSKPEIVHLVDMRRAKNCEIMLTKIKMPLPDMISAILALDTSVLDSDQVENLIKFCPTNEEIEMLKNYNGNKEMLGKCEQFFLELMKVPRVKSKLRVFAFRIAFSTQTDELRTNLTTINDATIEVRESLKLRQIMQTILTLGNALNQGSAVGFRLDSLLKLSDTRARNNKMTLMHYLCKLLAEKLPELLDFDKDLIHLEAASKIRLMLLAEEMQAIKKGLEKVEQELAASVNDGAISLGFRKALKSFLDSAEAVGKHADYLLKYFGEDPARCSFEQVTSILVIFVNMFKKSCDENARNAEAEKKKLEKAAIK